MHIYKLLLKKSIDDCKDFIKAARFDKKDLHLAIVDETDTYMGTVSLKHITKASAEFAITVRRIAMGKGYSRYAIREMIRLGMTKLGLQYIYWYVSSDNIRAIRFYDKNGYQRMSREDLGILDVFLDGRCIDDGRYIWYMVERINMHV